MLVIANNLNFSQRRIASLFRERPAEMSSPGATTLLNWKREQLLQEIARRCLAAGADILEINLQRQRLKKDVLRFAVEAVQQVADCQLCLSSDDAEALELAVPACRRPPLLNYVALEENRLKRILPLAARHGAPR